MPAIRFTTNIAVELHMKTLEPRTVDSQFGGSQHMFIAHEGAFYVSEAVGGILMDQFRKLDVKPGEPIEITKSEVAKPGRKPGIQWLVSRVGFVVAEEVPPPAPVRPIAAAPVRVATPEPPSELEQQLAASIMMVQQRKEAQRAAAAAAEQPKWAAHLAAQSQHLIDVYAQLVAHSTAKHGNAVRPDDIRSLMTTVYIGLTKNGGQSNAA